MDSAAPDSALIISNGRCGSTLLSDLLAEHDHTLSVQEFFMALQPEGTIDDVLTGQEYWELLSTPKADLSTLIGIGARVKELRYPSSGRYGRDLAAMPRILAITLPAISGDPDGFYDTLAGIVPGFPARPAVEQHRDLLNLLAELTGKRRWVERSGGSSHVAPYLLRAFTQSKIIYLTRERMASALSMSRHAPFQLIQLRVEFQGRCGYDPFHEPRPAGVVVPEDLERYLPERLTGEILAERGQDVGRFLLLGAFLSNQAEQALLDVPPAHLLRMSYEDLVDDPVNELGRVGRFLALEDWPEWAARTAVRVATPSVSGRT